MPDPTRRRSLRAATLVAMRALPGLPAVLAAPGPAAAQASSYPSRPVRLLVGFAPGGSSDIVARLLAQHLSTSLGQPVLVENRAGGGGMIAAEAVAKAAPDGHTLILIPSGHASQAAMISRLPFDPVEDFAWIGSVTVYPMFIAVAEDSPLRSLADLISRAKAAPGKLSFASAGIGTAHHLIGEWINAEAGTTITHVPYKGGTAPLTDVMSGRVDVLIETATAVLPHLRSGKLRALAVTSTPGKALLPGVAAASETLPRLSYESWLGLAAPGGTPRDIVMRLNTELGRALSLPDVRQKLAELGGEATAGPPEAFRQRVQSDIGRFRQVVAASRIPTE